MKTVKYENVNVYSTSDWHLGHEKVIELCGRPYDSIDSMNTAYIEMFNNTVKPDDVVYFAGDIVYKTKYLHLLEQLHGTKHLIIGNHDNANVQSSNVWKSVSRYAKFYVNGQKFIMSHFPFESWENQDHGSIHLHGHTHNNLSHSISKIKNRYDVGVDCFTEMLLLNNLKVE